MNFWTFFVYLIGALILMRVLWVVFLFILVSILGSILSFGKQTNYNRVPTYAPSRLQQKLFPEHETGKLANKLGDLSK